MVVKSISISNCLKALLATSNQVHTWPLWWCVFKALFGVFFNTLIVFYRLLKYHLLKAQIYFLALFLNLLRTLYILIEWSVFKIWIKIRRRKIKRLCFHQMRVTKTFYGGLAYFWLWLFLLGLVSSRFKALASFLLSFGAKSDPISPFLEFFATIYFYLP